MPSPNTVEKVDTAGNLKETVGENSCFPPHPFSALLSLGISPSADGDEGAALDSPAFWNRLDRKLLVCYA